MTFCANKLLESEANQRSASDDDTKLQNKLKPGYLSWELH